MIATWPHKMKKNTNRINIVAFGISCLPLPDILDIKVNRKWMGTYLFAYLLGKKEPKGTMNYLYWDS